MTQQEENNHLLNSFLERTWFSTWRNPAEGNENFKSIEIWLDAKCDLNCAYCYIARHGRELYPPEHQVDEKILKNLGILIDWLIENKYCPSRVEIFSGEPFARNLGFEAVEMILSRFENQKNKPERIVLPTNFTFMLNDEKVQRMERLLNRGREIGPTVHLSASIDGKYCEANRPFKSKKEDLRDDEYYDKVFAFQKKWGASFHPMIYSEHIEDWKDNFLWFQEMYRKHDIPWHNLYLLEVRNEEWSEKEILVFFNFIKFLIKWIHEVPCGNNSNEVSKTIHNSGFNILRAPISRVGRGMGCSLQSDFHVRMGDLFIVPCHRTSYEPFNFAHFVTSDSKIVGIEADNPELLIGTISLNSKNQPMCEMCTINDLCSFGCVGSQYESTGDLFSPIPTVCQLEHAKVAAIIEGLKEIGAYEQFHADLMEYKKVQFEDVEKMLESLGEPANAQ